MSVSRDTFLQLKHEIQEVEIPALGGTVKVRDLRSDEVTEFYKNQNESVAKGIAYILYTATQDDAGSPIFTEADADALSKRPFKITNPIVDAVLIMSGLREKPIEKKSDEKP